MALPVPVPGLKAGWAGELRELGPTGWPLAAKECEGSGSGMLCLRHKEGVLKEPVGR